MSKKTETLIFKQPKKSQTNYSLVDVMVAYCGKTETKQFKIIYKPDSICKPCCDFKAVLEKSEFAKVKAGNKIKTGITVENLCDTAASYVISGAKEIVFSQAKFEIKGKKSLKINLTITVPNSKSKTLSLPISIISCANKTKKTLNIKFLY